jgi:hypothetical protein
VAKPFFCFVSDYRAAQKGLLTGIRYFKWTASTRCPVRLLHQMGLGPVTQERGTAGLCAPLEITHPGVEDIDLIWTLKSMSQNQRNTVLPILASPLLLDEQRSFLVRYQYLSGKDQDGHQPLRIPTTLQTYATSWRRYNSIQRQLISDRGVAVGSISRRHPRTRTCRETWRTPRLTRSQHRICDHWNGWISRDLHFCG